MSAMLSSFIYRNSRSSKRKGKKTSTLNVAIRRTQTPPSPASFMSPEIMDINEKTFSSMARSFSPHLLDEEESYDSYESRNDDEYPLPRGNPSPSPQLQVELPSEEPLTDWFAHDLLRGGAREALGGSYERLNGSGSVNGSGKASGSKRGDGSREAVGFSSEEAFKETDEVNLEDALTQSVGSTALVPRKLPPAPIRIPNAAVHGPKVQIQRSNHAESFGVSSTGQGPATLSQPGSPMSADDISSISGTTIARALIANSFILSSDVRRSRHRSGMSNMLTRQDSATLPRGEHPFLNSPYWRDKRISGGDIILTPDSSRNSNVPPVPPMPSSSNLAIMSARSSTAGSELRESRGRRSGHELIRHPSASSIPPQRASGSEQLKPSQLQRSSSSSGVTNSERHNSRRISRIVEVPSPAPSAPNTPQKSASASSNGAPTPGPSPSPLAKLFYTEDPPSEYDSSSPPPAIVQRPPNRRSYSDTSVGPTSARSPNMSDGSMSIRNVLDDYMFMSSGDSDGAFSPGMAPESSASINAPAPYKALPKRASRKRKSNKLVLSTNLGSATHAGKARVDWMQRTSSDTRLQVPQQDSPKVTKLLPIGERPGSLLLPPTPGTPGSLSHSSSPSPLRLTSGSSPSTRFTSIHETSTDSPDILDSLLPPLSRGIFNRQRSGSTPNPITVVRESKDISHFDIKVGPEGDSSQTNTPSTGSGHQTFPETPNAFSPLWTTSVAGGSPGAHMPSLSAASSQAFLPGHSPRSASVSSQISLAQKVLLTRATTVSGDKPALLLPKLHSVKEVSERPMSAVVTPVAEKPSSPLDRVPSSEDLSENIAPSDVSDSRNKSLPPVPPMTPPVVPQIQVDGSQPSSVKSMTRPLPDILSHQNIPSSSSRSSSSNASHHAYPQYTPSSFGNHAVSDSLSTRSISPLPAPSFVSSSSRSISPAPQPVEALKPLSLHSPPLATITNQASIPLTPKRPFDSESSSSSAPPPYHTVVNGKGSTIVATPPGSRKGSDAGLTSFHEQGTPQTPSPNPSLSGHRSSSGSRRGRVRPPLPIGPRKPSSAQTFTLGPLNTFRDRNGSVSSEASAAAPAPHTSASTPSGRRNVLTHPTSPKFQTPVPKYRGYTMEAAKWTFTSQQLQSIVSRAIKQSAEASSVRLLQLETLDVDVPEEMHRLEMHQMDIKSGYKHLVRKRWAVMASLNAHTNASEGADPQTTHRALEELTEISIKLDNLAEEMHGVTEQLAHLKSLGDVHGASALAMALRKLNTSFLKQVTETQMLRQQVSSLEAERDEAWKQAEDVAQEYDDLADRYGGDYPMSAVSSKSANSRRSSRIMAIRKSSVRVSKAGLRPASVHRSVRSSSSSGHGRRGSDSLPVSVGERVPPVPPMPRSKALEVLGVDLPSRSSMAASDSDISFETKAMVKAQEELYDMLGLYGGGRPRPQSASSPSRHSRHLSIGMKSPYGRPVSDLSTPGLRTSSIPGSARYNRFYSSTNDSDIMLAATMGVISD